MPSSDSSRDVVLEQLAAEFVERHRRGERPPLSEYTDRHPDLAGDIRELFPALVQIEKLKPATDPTGAFEGTEVSSEGRTLERLGDYRILREVGRGGMGVVYEAEQESLGRHVALKVLPSSALLNSTYRERFRREAKAAARLHHTNIVPVFGVGESEGVPFYAMQFIQGQGLDKVLADVRRLHRQPGEAAVDFRPSEGSVAHSLLTGRFAPPTTADGGESAERPEPSAPPSGLSVRGPEAEYCRGVARIGTQVAEALAYAHRQGILHRDIKPSNLLLDLQGTVWITDFGLAKAEGTDELTNPGDIVGTIRFMAPERFDSRSLPQSDVYALGLTLYELLTLQTAFDDTNKSKLIEKVLHQLPVPPRKIDPNIPRDLETIVLKCLAKDPAERYVTAEALAEDLRRFLADRPIHARRTPWHERTWRWCRRNPVVAMLSAAMLLLLTVTAVGGVVMSLRLNDALGQAQKDRDKAWEAERQKKKQLFESLVLEAKAQRFSGRVGQRFGTLEPIRKAAVLARELEMPASTFDELRNLAIAALTLADLRLAKSWDGYPVGTTSLTFDAKFERYARSDSRGNISVRRVADDGEIVRLPGPGAHAFPLRFTPDGQFLLAGYHQVTEGLFLWNLSRRQVMWKPRARGAMGFSPDGRWVAYSEGDGWIRLCDLVSGKEEKKFASGPGYHTLAFDPSGRRLAVTRTGFLSVEVYDLDTGRVELRLPHPAVLGGLSWRPDGQFLAAVCGNDVYVWDVRTRKPQAILRGHEWPTSVTFSHSGDLLASSGWDATLRLWDPMTGRQLLSKDGGSYTPQFSPDDRLLGYTTTGSKVELWEVASGSDACRVLCGPLGRGGVWNADFSPDGRLLASADSDGVYLWDWAALRKVASLPLGGTNSVVFHPTDGTLYTCGGRGLYRWPIGPDPGSEPAGLQVGPPQLVGEAANIWRACFNPDGHLLVATDRTHGQAIVFDLRGKSDKVLLRKHPDIGLVAISPEGQWVATGTFGAFRTAVKVWDARIGKLVWDLPLSVAQSNADVAFSPDGRWLVTATPQEYRFWHVGSWQPGRVIPKEQSGGATTTPAFTRDGKILAVAHSARQVRLLDVATGLELASLATADPQRLFHLCFSPDGSQLAASCDKQVIQVWNLRELRRHLANMGLDWNAPSCPPAPEPAGRRASLPLQVRVLGAELVDPKMMAEYQRDRAVLDLYVNPFDADAHHRLGTYLLETGKPERAYAHLTAALAFRPGLDAARYERALAAFRLKRWADAAADASRFLDRHPDSHAARFLRAQAFRLSRRFKEAVSDYTALIEHYPRDAPLYELRAFCHEALGHADRAKADREQAIKLGPTDPTTLNNQAWRLVTGPEKSRDPAKALKLIQEAVKQQPENATFLNTLGVVQYRNGQYKEAVATLEKSLAASQEQHDGFDLFFLAMCHAKLGDPAKAKDCFDRAVKWVEGQKDLSAQHREELKAFRAEAEELLRNKPHTK